MLDIDWTLSVSNILTYLGVVIVLAWRISVKLNHFESTLETHANTLGDHADTLSTHDERFNRAMERVGNLAEQLQRLVGQSEVYFERWQKPRE